MRRVRRAFVHRAGRAEQVGRRYRLDLRERVLAPLAHRVRAVVAVVRDARWACLPCVRDRHPPPQPVRAVAVVARVRVRSRSRATRQAVLRVLGVRVLAVGQCVAVRVTRVVRYRRRADLPRGDPVRVVERIALAPRHVIGLRQAVAHRVEAIRLTLPPYKPLFNALERSQ